MRHFISIFLIASLLFACKEKHTSEEQIDAQQKTDTQSTDVQPKQNETALNEKQPSQNNGTDSVKGDTAHPKPDVSALKIIPSDVVGDQGQVTFSQKGKTIFYYGYRSKKGEINLNGKVYVLDKEKFNVDSYTLSGDHINITAPHCKYKKSKGEDCSYGKFDVVTITVDKSQLKLQNVEVQDCPAF